MYSLAMINAMNAKQRIMAQHTSPVEPVRGRSKPMKIEEATLLHECSQCRDGGSCDEHMGPGNCVYSCTCSVVCRFCKKSVYFTGDLNQQFPQYVCPYCGEDQASKHLGG